MNIRSRWFITSVLLKVLVALSLTHVGPPPVLAQEADTDVPIVNVGGAVHADVFTGQATMSIPIEVLPGRQGLQPDLALVYGSANGNGWVGMGWKLEKGVIERQLKFGVDYDADDYVFRLNGVNVELVPHPTEVDQYRAKIEGGFTRIEKRTDSADGPPYFVATDKVGTQYTFGKTARVAAPPPNGDRIFRWCLERVEDTNGNYMELTYESPAGTNQAYLKEIKYTGHEDRGLLPTTTVAFELEDRPDDPTLYTTHFPMRTTKRLKTILVKAPTNEVMRSYKLVYHETLSSSGRSLLQSVTQCGRPRTNGDETCLPAQTFSYTQPTGLTFSERLWSLEFTGRECPAGSGCRGRAVSPSGPVGSSDVDGNGRQELLGWTEKVKPAEGNPPQPLPDPDGDGKQPQVNASNEYEVNCEVDAQSSGISGQMCTAMLTGSSSSPASASASSVPSSSALGTTSNSEYRRWGGSNVHPVGRLWARIDHRLNEGPSGFCGYHGQWGHRVVSMEL